MPRFHKASKSRNYENLSHATLLEYWGGAGVAQAWFYREEIAASSTEISRFHLSLPLLVILPSDNKCHLAAKFQPYIGPALRAADIIRQPFQPRTHWATLFWWSNIMPNLPYPQHCNKSARSAGHHRRDALWKLWGGCIVVSRMILKIKIDDMFYLLANASIEAYYEIEIERERL